MSTVKIRSAYTPRTAVKLICQGEGRTKQAHKDECDVNLIMARFQKTGVLEFTEKRSPQYGDVTGVDFQEAMRTVTEAQEMFDELPSKVRNRFGNDPAAMLDFISDPINDEEAVKLGLLEAAKPDPEEAALPPKGGEEPPAEPPAAA